MSEIVDNTIFCRTFSTMPMLVVDSCVQMAGCGPTRTPWERLDGDWNMAMLRHIPSLYPHDEVDTPQEEEDAWDIQQPSARSISFSAATSPNTSSLSGTVRLKSRFKTYSPAGSFSSSGPSSSSSSSTQVPQYYARYHDIFSQFLMRYANGPGSGSEDPRNEPDTQYFQRGPSQQPVDAGDSDEEEFGRTLMDSSGDARDIFSSLLVSESIEPETPEERERLEWQTMLASVLDGDVLRSEKTRITVALAT